MKQEYDFSKGERGKFYQPDLKLIPPVHLEPKVLEYLAARAKARGIALSPPGRLQTCYNWDRYYNPSNSRFVEIRRVVTGYGRTQ